MAPLEPQSKRSTVALPRPVASLSLHFKRRALSVTAVSSVLLVVLATGAEAQTGVHGYVGGGMGIADCVDGCPPSGVVSDQVGMIGGGFGYPLRKGRIWITGDVTSRIVDGYFDASGGPSVMAALGSLNGRRFEPFVQGGPRWGDGGLRWNVGAGAQVWTTARVGLRCEYQYQWQNTVLVNQEFGPSGPIGPPMRSDLMLDEHLLRVAVALR